MKHHVTIVRDKTTKKFSATVRDVWKYMENMVGWSIGLLLIGAGLFALYRIEGTKHAISVFVRWITSPYAIVASAVLGLILLVFLAYAVYRFFRRSVVEEPHREDSFQDKAKQCGYRDIKVSASEGSKNIAKSAVVSFFRGGTLRGRVRSLHLFLKVSKRQYGHKFVRLHVPQIISVSKSTFGLSRKKVRVKLVDGSVVRGKLRRGYDLMFAASENSVQVLSQKAWFAIRS